jgi:hypothetical protein
MTDRQSIMVYTGFIENNYRRILRDNYKRLFFKYILSIF